MTYAAETAAPDVEQGCIVSGHDYGIGIDETGIVQAVYEGGRGYGFLQLQGRGAAVPGGEGIYLNAAASYGIETLHGIDPHHAVGGSQRVAGYRAGGAVGVEENQLVTAVGTGHDEAAARKELCGVGIGDALDHV